MSALYPGVERVRPGDLGGMIEALRQAAAAGRRVLPAGGECWLDLAGAGGPPDMVLSTGALNGVVFYEPGELVVRVGAGMTLAELKALLAERGQEIPWDVPWPDRQTVGGVLASGVNGPRRLAFGMTRDHVLGVTIALPEGRVVRPGGRVVKNVAGYDLTRLMAGSRGALGVMTDVTLKVKPLSEDAWTGVYAVPDAAALGRAMSAILGAALFPSFLEIDRGDEGAELAVGLEGLREQVDAQRRRVASCLEFLPLKHRHDREATFAFLAQWTARPWEPGVPVARISVPRRRTLDMLAAAGGPVQASAGNGVVRARAAGRLDEAAAAAWLGGLSEAATAMGGWAVQERGPLKGASALPGFPEAVRRLNARVRRVFDPAGVLAGDAVPA